MPEPFKNLFNPTLIADMGDQLAKAWPNFDRDRFIASATAGLDGLELKERSDQIMRALEACLPRKFDRAAEVLAASLAPVGDNDDLADATVSKAGIAGWAVLPMSHYVGLQGGAHFDIGMALFKEMTKRFTAEFGIRFFLRDDPTRTLGVLAAWVTDPSHHVRRLVSEGTRPRLPWAMQLPAFIADPAPLLPLLAALRDDGSDYVRRSVANNLNDIAKDHPDLVAGIAADWLQDAPPNRQRLVRHACRSLIKSGHRATLKALGYGRPQIELTALRVLTPEVRFGDALEFEIAFTSTANRPQPLIVDYVVHHRKANGKTAPKVFKWKATTLAAGATQVARRAHPIKSITTRTYHAGTHGLELLVNGQAFGHATFELTMPERRRLSAATPSA